MNYKEEILSKQNDIENILHNDKLRGIAVLAAIGDNKASACILIDSQKLASLLAAVAIKREQFLYAMQNALDAVVEYKKQYKNDNNQSLN